MAANSAARAGLSSRAGPYLPANAAATIWPTIARSAGTINRTVHPLLASTIQITTFRGPRAQLVGDIAGGPDIGVWGVDGDRAGGAQDPVPAPRLEIRRPRLGIDVCRVALPQGLVRQSPDEGLVGLRLHLAQAGIARRADGPIHGMDRVIEQRQQVIVVLTDMQYIEAGVLGRGEHAQVIGSPELRVLFLRQHVA